MGLSLRQAVFGPHAAVAKSSVISLRDLRQIMMQDALRESIFQLRKATSDKN